MSYEFTKLSDVPVVAEFPEGANAVIETNGEIKRCPSSGGGAAWDAVILCETANVEILNSFTYIAGNYESVASKLIANQPVNVVVIIHAGSSGDEAVYQCAASYMYYLNSGGESGVLLYAHQLSGSVPIMLHPDGTITKSEG